MNNKNNNVLNLVGGISPLEALAKEQRAKTERRELTNLKEFDRTAFNTLAEERFLEFVHELIRDDGGEVSKTTILKEAAFELNISTETVKRYLLKHTARKATLYETDTGKIRSKIHREIK